MKYNYIYTYIVQRNIQIILFNFMKYLNMLCIDNNSQNVKFFPLHDSVEKDIVKASVDRVRNWPLNDTSSVRIGYRVASHRVVSLTINVDSGVEIKIKARRLIMEVRR